ncbi:MAG: PilT/PilU family type 4a pilus ATPase [Acidobacteria bacterium]|nr:PilT/PilU family type 4a pilus ATPase [Acidobacteriota bacterium]
MAGITLSELLKKMVEMGGSDLHITTNSPPRIRMHGHLRPLDMPPLTAADTKSLAYSVLTDAQKHRFEENLELDFSFGLKNLARFRGNIFNQRCAAAAVFRTIPWEIKGFDQLGLAPVVKDLCNKPRGLVLVTGPTGSGKSTTLAAMLDKINSEREEHMITIEDPIEFLHNHKKSTVHQRELHSDAPNFALALRAALRQAPRVIMVGEIRDRETLEILLEAAENGHLVLSSMNTVDASKTVERIVVTFPPAEQQSVRDRLAKTFRYIIVQRLVPRADGGGRTAVVEILKSNSRGGSGDWTLLCQQRHCAGPGTGEKLAEHSALSIQPVRRLAKFPDNRRIGEGAGATLGVSGDVRRARGVSSLHAFKAAGRRDCQLRRGPAHRRAARWQDFPWRS